jgi:rhodanese-related sulfurtransferase
MITRMAMLVVGSSLVFGCRSSHTDATPTGREPAAASKQESSDAIRQVSIEQVATYVRTKSATVVDANGSSTREEMGVIPGAVLLSNYRTYALSELPAEKSTKLVFYCGGTMCRASDGAAERASKAGYKDVSVLRDGISGWRKSGQATEMPRS